MGWQVNTLNPQLEAEYSLACNAFAAVASDRSATQGDWDAAWAKADAARAALFGVARRKPRTKAYSQRFNEAAGTAYKGIESSRSHK